MPKSESDAVVVGLWLSLLLLLLQLMLLMLMLGILHGTGSHSGRICPRNGGSRDSSGGCTHYDGPLRAVVVAVVAAPESFDLVLVVAAPESFAPSSSNS